MREKCLNQNEQCGLRKRLQYSDTHHLYWPKNDYKGELEETFRELPMNKKQVCNCVHMAIHREQQPPKKPDPVTMLNAIREQRGYGRT